MDRRSFLGVLASLPFLRHLVPSKPSPKAAPSEPPKASGWAGIARKQGKVPMPYVVGVDYAGNGPQGSFTILRLGPVFSPLAEGDSFTKGSSLYEWRDGAWKHVAGPDAYDVTMEGWTLVAREKVTSLAVGTVVTIETPPYDFSHYRECMEVDGPSGIEYLRWAGKDQA